MSGIQPVAVYAMRIPPNDILVPAVPEFAAMFRLTMAAIDPAATPDLQEFDDNRKSRATLKLVRFPESMFDSDDDDDEDEDEEDEDYLDGLEDDESSENNEENGGPSEPRKSKKLALLETLAVNGIFDNDEDEDVDDDEDMSDSEAEDSEADAKALASLQKIMKSSKGKGKAVDGEKDNKNEADEHDEDEDEDEDLEGLELDEVVLCTLDPEKHYQQPLDFVVGEGERVFFKVSGTHTVHLTGNYVIPQDDGQASLYDEDDEGYDLSPDEEELEALEDDEEEESDALDDIADPRITELNAGEDEALAQVKGTKKGKNKRAAEEIDEDDADLDDLMAKSLKKDEVVPDVTMNGDNKKLSKAEKKKLKKLKMNNGEAADPAAADIKTATEPKKETQTNGTSSEKKVQFAKNLEQGPTPSAAPPANKSEKTSDKSNTKTSSLGIRDVQGVHVDVRKIGTGPEAKKGTRIEMRYVGKLDDGKVFDSNKSGKPFSFKLGVGEVIKGWDIGMQGIQVGGERRLIIPANLAYGNKALPGIPKNSKLTFDVKCLTIK